MLCEKAILDQQALIPIYTEDFIVLNQLRVRGLQLEAYGMLDFSALFIKELK
jgi:MarR-like DNA-binding transcriptional regulator SgrR of sgrS sRNA